MYLLFYSSPIIQVSTKFRIPRDSKSDNVPFLRLGTFVGKSSMSVGAGRVGIIILRPGAQERAGF